LVLITTLAQVYIIEFEFELIVYTFSTFGPHRAMAECCTYKIETLCAILK
jgi:hypothetical protein